MSITAHQYLVLIKAEPESVWQAMTDSDWTTKYFYNTHYDRTPAAGEAYRMLMPDGTAAVEGVIEEATPPSGARPGRLVQTWRVLYDPEMAEEPAGRVEWTVERAGDGLTRVRVRHGDLAGSPLTWESTREGWVYVLDGLKSVLETGAGLPPADDPAETPPAAGVDADWHRRQAVLANNATWDVLTQDHSPARDENLLRHAYAAAYHWERAAGATELNEVRACYLIARALADTGQGERALLTAQRCLDLCTEHGHADFDLAYAWEAKSRALLALGRDTEAGEAAARARSVAVADAEDRALVESDLADLPHPA